MIIDITEQSPDLSEDEIISLELMSARSPSGHAFVRCEYLARLLAELRRHRQTQLTRSEAKLAREAVDDALVSVDGPEEDALACLSGKLLIAEIAGPP